MPVGFLYMLVTYNQMIFHGIKIEIRGASARLE